ncbi:MAG: FtsX-like permease family protein, partial [Steroidobacteraceae bacterium]|nr:FtsX-like permease family protein [Steroidobacteraceae bacterium]
RRYVQRHLDSVALLKTLGATRSFTLAVSLLQLLAIALLATLLGSLVGYFAQEWLLEALRDLLKAELPPASLAPIGLGLITAVAVLAGFALPPLLQLARVPAIRVLRRDVGPPPPVVWLAFGPAVTAVVGMIAWVVRDLRLFIGFVVGLTVFVAVLAAAGWLLVSVTSRLRGGVGVAWRYGVANLARRRVESIVQIAAFGLGIMVLLLLGIVRNDLLADWRRSLPPNLPNFFFINIPPDERAAFERFLADNGAETSRVLPMIRARLIEIDGQPVERRRIVRGPRGGPRGGGDFADREQNITWTDELGPDNKIVAGRWFTPGDFGKPLVSLSTEFADSLGLRIGSRLAFDVAGERFDVTLASIRQVKWDSFRPNFFIVFAPGLLEGAAGTWMTSAYVESHERALVAPLVRRFPSVSVFDLEELLAQVRSVVDKAALAIQSVFAFTLFAGLTVLLAALQASRDERRFESAMLRTLGASRAVVRQGVLAEFLLLGALAGVLAASGASIAGWLLAHQALDVPYRFSIWVWGVGVVGGALLVAVSGWLATRWVITHPPIATLRAGQ